MSGERVNPGRNFDQRLNDWLEEGAQSVPDWLVESALEQAHATPQLGRGLRLPWAGARRRLELDLGRLAPALVGAVGALVVVAAFVLGLVSAPHIGDDRPTPTPSPTASSHPPSPSVGPAGGLQLIDILPGVAADAYAMVGMTSTRDAVWTVVVTDSPPGRLVRIDAVTGAARAISIPDARGLLSPPAADGDVVWTASAAGLHRVDATGEGAPVTIPLDFLPAEIAASDEGLWVAREGGTSLVDRTTGQVLRVVEGEARTTSGRIIGGPHFGSLWACPELDSAQLMGPTDGAVRATVQLPSNSDCRGRFVGAPAIQGLGDAVIPEGTNAVLDPLSGRVVAEIGFAWTDVIAVDGRLWFLQITRDPPGLALVELDPATLGPASTYTMAGVPHLNTSFESGHLAIAGGYVWVLGAPVASGAEQRPQIMRVPLAALGDG